MFNHFVFKHSLTNQLDRKLFKMINMCSLSKSTIHYHNLYKDVFLYKMSKLDFDDIFDM